MDEGVVKYRLIHEMKDSVVKRYDILDLIEWRNRLFGIGLIGSDKKYCYGKPNCEGIGYGNVSQRTFRGIIISGTQTGNIDTSSMDERYYTLITSADPDTNTVHSEGPIEPSSEVISHKMFYDQDPAIMFVFHVHSPRIWNARERLRLPTTRESVAYGTPSMAYEIERLYRETDVRSRKVIAMAGHEDGIFFVGSTADDTGQLILETYRLAA